MPNSNVELLRVRNDVDYQRAVASPEAWREMGLKIARDRHGHEMAGSQQMWEIGDWLLSGESTVFKHLTKMKVREMAAEVSTYSVHTLVMAVSVARKIEPSMRIDGLSWWHHLVAAKLDLPDRESWLTRAAEGGWSPREFRDELAREGKVARRRRPVRARQTVGQLLQLHREDIDHNLLSQLTAWWRREISAEMDVAH